MSHPLGWVSCMNPHAPHLRTRRPGGWQRRARAGITASAATAPTATAPTATATSTTTARPVVVSIARERGPDYEAASGGGDPWQAAAATCRQAAEASVDGLDADQVKSAVQQVAAARRSLDAASARLVRAAEDLDAHRQDGAADTTSWLRDTTGVSARDAKAQAMLGRDLEMLPQTAEALAEGRIGTDQAATIGRAARGGRLGDAATTEARLLPDAQQAPERFARKVRAAEQEADGDLFARDERRARAQRRLSMVDRPDGLVARAPRPSPSSCGPASTPSRRSTARTCRMGSVDARSSDAQTRWSSWPGRPSTPARRPSRGRCAPTSRS